MYPRDPHPLPDPSAPNGQPPPRRFPRWLIFALLAVAAVLTIARIAGGSDKSSQSTSQSTSTSTTNQPSQGTPAPKLPPVASGPVNEQYFLGDVRGETPGSMDGPWVPWPDDQTLMSQGHEVCTILSNGSTSVNRNVTTPEGAGTSAECHNEPCSTAARTPRHHIDGRPRLYDPGDRSRRACARQAPDSGRAGARSLSSLFPARAGIFAQRGVSACQRLTLSERLEVRR
jgi:hypothetical protein